MPDGVVVAAGEQARPRGRAQGGDVEAVVAQPAGGEPVDGRGVDVAAEAAELAEPQVVEHDHQHVRRALRGMGAGREHRRRLGDRAHRTKLPRRRWFPPPGPRRGSVSHSEARDRSAICPTLCAAGGRTATVRGAPLTGAGADNGGQNVQALTRHGRAATGGPGDPAARGTGGCRAQSLREAQQQHDGEAAGVRDAGGGARAPGRVAGHRRRQRGQPVLRLARLRRLGRLRGPAAQGGGLRPRGASVRLHGVQTARSFGAPANRAGAGHLRRGRRLRHHRPVRPR